MEKDNELGISDIYMIGKYFKSNRDFINVIKLCKKYKDLIEFYKYNPISDYEMFENMQTQHIYSKDDFDNRKEGVYMYEIEHNVLPDSFIKNTDLYITQRKRLWIIYLSLPLNSSPESDYKDCNFIHTNKQINSGLDDIEIYKVFTDNTFASTKLILDDMNDLISRIKDVLKSDLDKDVFCSFNSMQEYINDPPHTIREILNNDLVYSNENIRLENTGFISHYHRDRRHLLWHRIRDRLRPSPPVT